MNREGETKCGFEHLFQEGVIVRVSGFSSCIKLVDDTKRHTTFICAGPMRRISNRGVVLNVYRAFKLDLKYAGVQDSKHRTLDTLHASLAPHMT